MDGECKSRCVEIVCKRQRMLVKLRGGMAELRIETGRWCGLSRDERICKNCMKVKWKILSTFYCIVHVWLRRGWRWRG